MMAGFVFIDVVLEASNMVNCVITTWQPGSVLVHVCKLCTGCPLFTPRFWRALYIRDAPIILILFVFPSVYRRLHVDLEGSKETVSGHRGT